MGPKMSRANTLKGAVTKIERTDLGGELVFAYFLKTLNWLRTANVSW